jgi:hypothetical protein
MPDSMSAEKQLAQLNREIDELEADIKRLEAERTAVSRQSRRAGRRFRYLNVLRSLRAPAARFNLWPMAVLAIGPLIVGVIALVFVHLLTGSYPAAFFAFLLGIVAGVGLFATMIYHPADTLLPAAIHEAEAQARLENARHQEKTLRLAETKEQLEKLVEERRERIASGKVQRASLLQRDWKKMPATEWEDFVVEACRTLGAAADRAKRIDDEGANLVVSFGSRRIAVKTLVAREPIQSAVVQKVLADKASLGCDACAVVTTGRFTGAAQDFAARNGCTIIGRDDFPDFVMGKIEL